MWKEVVDIFIVSNLNILKVYEEIRLNETFDWNGKKGVRLALFDSNVGCKKEGSGYSNEG